MSDFDTIRDALRNASTVEEVEAVADKFRADVRAMAKTDKARATIISNLKENRICTIKDQE